MNKKVYSGIDIGKLIAAILVVVLHAVETSAWIPAAVKYITTLFAVPFFFIASGFFFYKGLTKADDTGLYFQSYEKHVLKVLFVWELIIYLPFTIKTYLSKYAGVSLPKFVALLARRILIIGSGPYWYLIALFWAAAFLYLCNRFKHGKALLVFGIVIGIMLEICYACFQSALSVFPVFRCLFEAVYGVWSWENNFFMYGIPFMGVGWLLAEYKVEWTTQRALIVFLLNTILRFLEYSMPILFPYEFWQKNGISLAFIPQALAFFLLMKAWRPQITRQQSLTLRQLSSTIYYTHAIFLYELLDPLMDRYTNLPTYAGIMILPKVLVTLLLSTLFFLIVKKINKPSLNILING